MDISTNTEPADPAKVHTALLAGLLSHIGLRDMEKPEYLGARGARFSIFPGSVLYRRNTRWVMAAELVETTRLWGRVAARIEPEWAERLAGHLVKRSYSEPHWERDRGSVVAIEKVTLYGLPIVAGRKVQYGRIDPELSRELFIRHALVEGDWRTPHAFFHENRALLEEVEELEARARRRDILVEDEALFAFYDARIPADVVSARHFDTWWKRPGASRICSASPRRCSSTSRRAVSTRALSTSGARRTGACVTYQFEPGRTRRGHRPHSTQALNQVAEDGFDWQIPGCREDLVTALIVAHRPSGATSCRADYTRAFSTRPSPRRPADGHAWSYLARLTGVTAPSGLGAG
jgi:ATP-dependent helicase HrpA